MLSEVLLAIFVITILMGFTLPLVGKTNDSLQAEKYQSELIVLQSEAMLMGQKVVLDNIKFNEFGHINLGRTVKFKKKKLVMFLGMGKSEVRQRDDDD